MEPDLAALSTHHDVERLFHSYFDRVAANDPIVAAPAARWAGCSTDTAQRVTT